MLELSTTLTYSGSLSSLAREKGYGRGESPAECHPPGLCDASSRSDVGSPWRTASSENLRITPPSDSGPPLALGNLAMALTRSDVRSQGVSEYGR